VASARPASRNRPPLVPVCHARDIKTEAERCNIKKIITWKDARKALFPKLTLSQVEALLWECTPYPMTDLEDVLLRLEVMAGVHAAGEPFNELMFLFGSDMWKTQEPKNG